jgi:hypothetical protein
VGPNAGELCLGTKSCTLGICLTDCPPPLVLCPDTTDMTYACVDPATSTLFCGATGDCMGQNAGVLCPQGSICVAGRCTGCPDGMQWCQGTCVAPGTCTACMPQDTTPCGPCGMGVRTCEADGGWSACAVGQACVPGDDRPCGVGGHQACATDCSWGGCVEPACTPGMTAPCGECLLGSTTCQTDGTWGACDHPGCHPGTTLPCGANGTGTQTCQANCTYTDCVEMQCPP